MTKHINIFKDSIDKILFDLKKYIYEITFTPTSPLKKNPTNMD